MSTSTTTTTTSTTKSPTAVSVWPKGSIYDIDKPSGDWEEWFSPEQYASPYNERHLPSLKDCPQLDNPTRYLIQLLQDVYDGTAEAERPTTESCNRAIQQLSDEALLLVVDHHDEPRQKLPFLQRATAILRHMELFFDFPTKHRLAYQLPFPNNQTYLGVLKMYAECSRDLSAEDGPQKCQQIVEKMQQYYDESGVLDLKPNVVHWNQVLASWAVCSDHKKSFYAAKLLQDLLQDRQTEHLVDTSSYAHVLRACAFSNFDDESRKLSSKVALHVWKKIEENDNIIERTPHMYAFYLQCCSSIENERTKVRDRSIQQAFEQCCAEGKVNEHVLHAFKRAASAGLHGHILGKAVGDDMKKDPAELVKLLPSEWTQNAKFEKA
jgi:hypothetical protein